MSGLKPPIAFHAVETPMPAKPWWKSRLIWLQIVGLVVSVVAVFAASPSFLPYAETFAIVQSVLGIILRFLTTQPISGG